MRITWKPGQMLPTFDYTITVLNKLAARDSATKLDVWKATVLHNCSWSGRAERSVQGNTVSVGNVFVRSAKRESFSVKARLRAALVFCQCARIARVHEDSVS